MDANDRNDSTNRERDAKLARRIGEALDQMNPHGTATDCPDAEMIAAYSEQALDAAELMQCENHFATCGRCRNIVKVLAAATDVPLAETEVAQLGQRVATVRTPVEITSGATKRPRSKVALWSTRWLAPAFGVAAVLTVWFVMRPPWRAMDRSGSTTLIAQAPQQEMPEATPLAVGGAEKAAPARETPPAKTDAPNSYTAPSSDDQLTSKDAIRDASPNEGLAKGYSHEKKEAAPIVSENHSKRLAEPPPLPASVSPPRVAGSSAMNSAAPLPHAQARMDSAASTAPVPAVPNPAEAGATRSEGQAVTAMQASPSAEGMNQPAAEPMRKQAAAAAEAPVNGRNFQALTRLSPGASLLVKFASGTSLWRAGIAGAIDCSTDQGKTWSPQISPSKEDWLAGAAVADTVAWLVGRNGAIARTTDGEHWARIAPPSQSAAKDGKLSDWTGVIARDAQSAILTAGDGTKFATSDGGKTWQQQ
jgi:hypothetical protein